MKTLLNGGKIAESMKYICNAIVSIMVSLLVSYGVIKLLTVNKKASKNELIDECEVDLDYTPIQVVQAGTHKEYSPRSDSSSSGGSFGGGGSSGGGRRRFFWKWWKPWILKINVSK